MRTTNILCLLACLTAAGNARSPLWRSHKNAHNSIMAMHEEMEEQLERDMQHMREQFERSQQRMQEAFNACASYTRDNTYAAYDNVDITYDERDQHVDLRVHLSDDMHVDLSSITAEFEDGVVNITVPHDHGQLHIDVSDAYVQLATEYTMQSDGHGEDRSDASQHVTYAAASQSMLRPLPARVNPMSIKKNDAIKATYDEDTNVLIFTFEKRKETVTVERAQHASENKEHADRSDKKAAKKKASKRNAAAKSTQHNNHVARNAEMK